jgi:hypothetical protein
MKQTLLWVGIALIVGAAVVPISNALLWSMRSSFTPDYSTLKQSCAETAGTTITTGMEDEAASWQQEHPALVEFSDCETFFENMAAYKRAIPGRSYGFGVVVFIALIVVRFVVFSDMRREDWKE